MRIGIDARYLNGQYSGIQKYSENLIRELSALDQDNEYEIYIHPGFRRSLPLGENFTVHTFDAQPVSLKTLWGFGRFIRQHELALLHSLFPLSPLTFDGPLLVTVHDLQPLLVPGFTGRRRWLLKKCYDTFYHWFYPTTIKRAKYVISVSKSTRDDLVDYFPTKEQDTIVIPNGLEPEYHEPVPDSTVRTVIEKHSLPDDYLLYIGSTRPNKNLPTMIRAFAELVHTAKGDVAEQIRDLTLVLVVSPDRFFNECLQLIRTLNIQERVKIFHSITETEKRTFYQRARALYFVTKNEGFGFPLLEAQASRIPVLAAEHASLPEIAQGTALLVNPDAIDEIVDGLTRIVTDDDLRERLIEDGEANARRFTWRQAAMRVLEVYTHLY